MSPEQHALMWVYDRLSEDVGTIDDIRTPWEVKRVLFDIKRVLCGQYSPATKHAPDKWGASREFVSEVQGADTCS